MTHDFKLTTKWKGALFIAGAFLAIAIGFLFPKSALAYGTTLYPGESLTGGAKLESASGQFAMIMQGDGNFVSYFWPQPYWASNTGGNTNARIVMQTDGNLVIYRQNGSVAWASNTNGHWNSTLVLQDDGNAVIRNSAGVVVWSPNAVPTKLPAGQLLRGDRSWQIFSPDRRYRMVMQTDGNIVLYDGGVAIWAKHGGGAGATFEMQTDANLVLYNAAHVPIWATNKFGPNGSYLEGQNDGNFVVYTPSRGVLWSTRTDSTPTGTRAQLAQQVLNHVNITRPGRCVDDDLLRTAAGGATANGSYLNERMLINTLELARDRRIKITSITGCGSGHASGSTHYAGKAIDLQPNTGNTLAHIASTIYHNRGSWNINQLIHDPMPAGTSTLLNGNPFTYDATTRNGHRTHVHHSTN